MAALPESARALIESGAHGHLVTINPDGSPQVSLVWVGVDGDDLVVASMALRQKVKNVQRDPRVVVSFESDAVDSERGLLRYLTVTGAARISEGGAPELLQRLAHTFLGPGVRFPQGENLPGGYVMRIVPERWAGNGPWSDPAQ
jgi:PPOX class probable F420-dependent enzyme